MPKFHVKDTFTVEGRSHFILAGSVIDGKIQIGMSLQIPMNSITIKTARIEQIEFARLLGGQEDTCLCIRYSEPAELEMLRNLDIAGETLEVTKNP